MPSNDFLLIITWVVGIGGAAISAVMAKRQVRRTAQIALDKASFEGAEAALGLLGEQIAFLKGELTTVRGELSSLRVREVQLVTRIRLLEHTLQINGITAPTADVV